MANLTPAALEIGQEIHGRPYTLTLERLLAFSGGPLSASDWPARNLHTDGEMAAEAGFDAPIASGIQYEGHALRLLLEVFGEAWSRHGTLRTKYVRPVPVGDTVRTWLTVAGIADGLCTMDVRCVKADGEPALVGTATCPTTS